MRQVRQKHAAQQHHATNGGAALTCWGKQHTWPWYFSEPPVPRQTWMCWNASAISAASAAVSSARCSGASLATASFCELNLCRLGFGSL